MEKLKYTMLMLTLVSSMSALAQTDTPSNAARSDKMSSKEKTLIGCVIEKGGKYILVDEKHPDGVQLITSEDLKPHVGHKMNFTGSLEKTGSSGPMKADDKITSLDQIGMLDLKVSDMKMISEKCETQAK